MLKDGTVIVVENDYESFSTSLYLKDIEHELKEEDITADMCDVFDVMLHKNLINKYNAVIKKGKVTIMYNDDYTFLINLVKREFFIGTKCTAKTASILTERILAMYPDMIFKDVLYKTWKELLFGTEAERHMSQEYALSNMFDEDKFSFIEI